MSTGRPALRLARYRFGFRMQARLDLPDYAGSLLRGQFGAALRQASCMTRAPVCEGCPLRTTCPYPAVFEAPGPAAHSLQNFSHIPNAYVVEPPPLGTREVDAGEMLHFGLVLFGQALRHLPLISFALQRAVDGGLGRARAAGTLETIDVQRNDDGHHERIWQVGDTAIAEHDTEFEVVGRNAEARRLTLAFHTPLRLQHQGKPLRPQQLTPRKLVADLLRRATLLAEFHADRRNLVDDPSALVRLAETLEHRATLRWHDWSRFSSRQQREMTLGGALGTWTLEGTLAPLLPWLHLGQWLHVGKNATLGMGGYTIVECA